MNKTGLLAGYYTQEELASELGVNVRTIREWDRMSVGPPRTSLGRTILYRHESVKEWLAGREIKKRRKGTLKLRAISGTAPRVDFHPPTIEHVSKCSDWWCAEIYKVSQMTKEQRDEYWWPNLARLKKG